jgi:hypothetical protein
MSHLRTVDLGREDELVTWQEWFNRSARLMGQLVDDAQRGHLVFRVTLADGRAFAVRQALTHVARGRCQVDLSRWARTSDDGSKEGAGMGAACDVITGYMLVGTGSDERPTVVSVPPTEIASVECVLVEPKEEPQPFGFARYVDMKDRPALEEVEEELHTSPQQQPKA